MKGVQYKVYGNQKVHGEIKCFGAKNLSTKAMLATLLSNEKSTLFNVPDIGEVAITIDMLRDIGTEIDFGFDSQLDSSVMKIDPSKINRSSVTLEDSRLNRIPILLLSVLLQKFDEVHVPRVTGDNIGKRNVDYHLDAIQAFGAEIEVTSEGFIAKKKQPLKGAKFVLPYPSVGATETCLFLSVLADGVSMINNIALEPEIIQLINILRCMGAVIFLNPNRELIIYGVKKLRGINFSIIGDRIEAISWACLAYAVNGGDLTLRGISPDLICVFLSYLNIIGGKFEIINNNTIRFYNSGKIRGVAVETDVHPGFATDWQQPFAVLLTQAEGSSVIHETVYENRMGYIASLNKLGADISIFTECLGSVRCRYRGCGHLHSAIIKGGTKLFAIKEPIVIPDIRAGLAYFVAAIIASGETELLGAEKIERGYGNLEKRLKNTDISIIRN